MGDHEEGVRLHVEGRKRASLEVRENPRSVQWGRLHYLTLILTGTVSQLRLLVPPNPPVNLLDYLDTVAADLPFPLHSV